MFSQSVAEIPSITWIHITFLISVSACQPQYFPSWCPLTESGKGKVKSLRPEKKFAMCRFGHLILGILQEVWLQKCSALAPWKPSDRFDWFAHTHTHTHLHDCWAHECLPEKLPRNMQWLCTSPARCKWLQVLFCISSSLMEKQQKKEDGWTADKITYAGGPLYSFGVRKFFNKEGGNCQQKRKSVQNRCRSNLERSTMWHRWPRAR